MVPVVVYLLLLLMGGPYGVHHFFVKRRRPHSWQQLIHSSPRSSTLTEISKGRNRATSPLLSWELRFLFYFANPIPASICSNFHHPPVLNLMVSVVAYLLLMLSAMSAAAADSTRNIALPGCPTSCGNISIPYPFGIRPGCFRSAFQLTCNNHKLYLGDNTTIEVIQISISDQQVYVNAPIFSMPANADSYSTYWTPLKGGPYTAASGSNYFYVVGCGISAYLADAATGEVIAACLSVCDSNQSAVEGTMGCEGYGCCQGYMGMGYISSYEIRLERLHGGGRGSGKAFLASDDYYTFKKQDLISSDLINGSSAVRLALDWAIRDQSSCKEAERNKSNYACRSDNSFCQEQYGGYKCLCSSWSDYDYDYDYDLTLDGNPYISGGCPGVTNKLNCSGPCGNISIPYPFGLGTECARDSAFVLFCNKTNDPPLLIFQDVFQVTKIMVEEGQFLGNVLRKVPFASTEVYIDGSDHYTVSRSTIVVDWVMGYMSCGDALKIKSSFPCNRNHSECQDLKNFWHDMTATSGPAYRCRCSLGYQGNPYTAPGCIDIDECNDPEKYKCNGTCINSAGSFKCVPSPRSGAFDRAKGIFIGVTAAVGFSLLLLSTRFLYWRWTKRTLKRIREKHFHKNRGLLLQQLISSNDDIANRTSIFSLEELAKATNNFDEARILGRGGHGMVFKGILLDQRVVAIKKSNINVQSEIDQFLNEVVILSQINHRNVVKLYGCCLETEVPLLVYEFVSNGTLSDHLHLPDRRSSLSWEDRLSIARDTSRALSYLHSAASISIFHRDVKSSNILLDDHCFAKVSDFGTSRSIPLDMTRVVTVVQGTFGYLDPEYYHTGELTEKSDVYSFGVILVELLTGEKPISFTRPEEERNLCMHFLSALRDGRLSQIIEARVLEEATRKEIDTICKLAETCLSLSGEDRPTMKGVEVSLEGLRRIKTRKRHPWKEPEDEESASLLPSTEPRYGNHPESAILEEMPGGSNSKEQSIPSLTLPR